MPGHISAPAAPVQPSLHTAETVVDFGGSPYDLPATLGVLQRGFADPAVQIDAQHRGRSAASGTPGAGAWLCQHIYDDAGAHLGAVTYRFDQIDASAVEVQVAATTAEAAAAALQRAPAVLGAGDDWWEFELLLDALGDRISTELAGIRRRNPGLRLPATGALFDQLVTVTLEQKVTHDQARHSWRNLLRRFGEAPPLSEEMRSKLSQGQLRLPLRPEQLRWIPSWQWHKLWVQPPLSKTVLRLAERGSAIHRLAAVPAETTQVAELAETLTSIPGIGPWTVAEALQRSHGSADLPAVRDYHLAHFVGEALTGRRTDDAGMLRLLEPFRPHRQRVVRLLGLSGFRMSRFGPRLAPEDHRDR